jgi:hypothetical protein
VIEQGLAGGIPTPPRQLLVMDNFRTPARIFTGGLLQPSFTVLGESRRTLDRRLESTELALDGFPEVLQQVEPIRDLPRLRRALACTVGVGWGAGGRLEVGIAPETGHAARSTVWPKERRQRWRSLVSRL